GCARHRNAVACPALSKLRCRAGQMFRPRRGERREWYAFDVSLCLDLRTVQDDLEVRYESVVVGRAGYEGAVPVRLVRCFPGPSRKGLAPAGRAQTRVNQIIQGTRESRIVVGMVAEDELQPEPRSDRIGNIEC